MVRLSLSSEQLTANQSFNMTASTGLGDNLLATLRKEKQAFLETQAHLAPEMAEVHWRQRLDAAVGATATASATAAFPSNDHDSHRPRARRQARSSRSRSFGGSSMMRQPSVRNHMTVKVNLY